MLKKKIMISKTFFFRFARSMALHTSSSVCASKGSTLYLKCVRLRKHLWSPVDLMVPWKRTGSWGMTAIADLRSASPISLMFTCKYWSSQFSGSIILNYIVDDY